tara:strand:+ start:1033 stop:1668 length:636 start_codon:yes stop_codon:yes gene_type:complete
MKNNKNFRSKFIDSLRHQGIKNELILEILATLPREIFIEPALRTRAYDQDALPIGCNQTISSPYIVAKMSEIIYERDNMGSVLEIGTGCGYQTAILSSLFDSVVSIERIEALHLRAKKTLASLNLKNITLIHGDGHEGYSEQNYFDAIILTAAPVKVPDKLLDQLNENGRMILPLHVDGSQKLYRLKKTKNGIHKKDIDDVRFVPMLEGKV